MSGGSPSPVVLTTTTTTGSLVMSNWKRHHTCSFTVLVRMQELTSLRPSIHKLSQANIHTLCLSLSVSLSLSPYFSLSLSLYLLLALTDAVQVRFESSLTSQVPYSLCYSFGLPGLRAVEQQKPFRHASFAHSYGVLINALHTRFKGLITREAEHVSRACAEMLTRRERQKCANSLVCLLQALAGQRTKLELRNEISVTGTIVTVDSSMKLAANTILWCNIHSFFLIFRVQYYNRKC